MTRALDLVISGLALLLLLPLFLPVMVVLAFTGEGEVFYVQKRVGRNGEDFSLLKFATMLKDSPNIGAGSITLKDDPRVLPIGRVLRKTKINELPQLINVFCGDMSLIGPRPMTRVNYDMYSEAARAAIGTVRPGLSGVGSIIFRDEEELLAGRENPRDYYRYTIAPFKAEVEIWYIENRGLFTYLKCIFLTILVVIRPASSMPMRLLDKLPIPNDDLRTDFDAIRSRRTTSDV